MLLDDSNFGTTPNYHPTHKLFFQSSIYLFVIALVLHFYSPHTFSIQLHDTYFTLPLSCVSLALLVVSLVLGCLYVLSNLILKIYLRKKLSVAHYYTTTITLSIILFLFLANGENNLNIYFTRSSSPLVLAICIFTLILFLAQFLFIINLWVSISQK
ncbi:MAG: hypothetical protein AAF573_07490 [Bacteroidota bacterium]